MEGNGLCALRDLLARSGTFAGEKHPVRIVFRLDSEALPAWVASCLRVVAGLPGTAVSVATAPAPNDERFSKLWSWFNARVRAIADPCASVPTDALADILGERGEDLVVNCSSSYDPAAWWFALDGQPVSPDLREFFWHAASGPRPIELSLRSSQSVLGTLRIPPVAGLYWTQHAEAMNSASALLLFALLANPSHQPALSLDERRTSDVPGSLAVSLFVARKLLRSLHCRLPGTGKQGRWQIAFHSQAQNAPRSLPDEGWQWINGFEGHQAADPFLVEDDSNLWLFYEDVMPNGHGRLAVLPADDETAEPVVILEKPYHLSYPHVFHHGREWWMIPESAANRTVDLYRAARFPFEWVHERTLCQGPELVDTTPLFHEGIWYFFTTALLPGRGLASLLFTAEDLTAAWRLHPAAPISLDAALSRGAGSIFYSDGRLYRPVQDCLVRYGYAITLREIVTLTPGVFEERTVSTVLPDWQRGLTATHTFSQAGLASVLDARRLWTGFRTSRKPIRRPAPEARPELDDRVLP